MAPMMSALTAFLLLAPRPAAAHEYPIAPVDVTIKVEPDRVAVDIESDSIYWIEEVVGLHPMPPRNWPADARAKTEKYVNEHLRLKADEATLKGTLVDAEYVQRPWEVYEQGKFRLRVSFPPVGKARELSGSAEFFEEYRQERLLNKEPMLSNQTFLTHVSIPGDSPRHFELRQGSNSFSLPVAAVRRTTGQRIWESLLVGMKTALGTAEGWPALAALALSFGPGSISKRKLVVACATLLVGAALARGAVPPRLEWLAGILGAIAAGRWLGAGGADKLELVAISALGGYWSARSAVRLPRAVPSFTEFGISDIGILAMASVLLGAGIILVRAQANSLRSESESRSAELFERRRRLAATVLLIVCGFGATR
jgi:hypothetical protein